MRELIAVGTGGFVGAVARYLVSGWVHRVAGYGFPWGTLAVNVVGCFALGALVAAIEDRVLVSAAARSFLAIGLLGSLTTFSTFGYETIELLRKAQPLAAAGNVVAQLLLGCMAVVAGRELTSWLLS